MSKLLLVEDSPTARNLVRVFLMGVPAEIVEAGSAEQALALLDDPQIEVIVSDHQLPGMEGLDLVKLIRTDARPHVAKVGVILLTSEAIETDAYRSGVDAFIKKPVKDSSLRDAVMRLLAKSPSSSDSGLRKKP